MLNTVQNEEVLAIPYTFSCSCCPSPLVDTVKLDLRDDSEQYRHSFQSLSLVVQEASD